MARTASGTRTRAVAGRHWWYRASCGLAVCALLCASACAPKQRVPLDISPTTASIYLDGEPLEGMPPELMLRSDRDHTLFFKSEGHRSELIVLRSGMSEGKPRLQPASVRLRLAPLDLTRRELVIEAVDEAPDPPLRRGEAGDVGTVGGD